MELTKECVALAGDDFYVCIPDLMENLDVIAALRGPMPMIYDLIEEPEEIEARVKQIGDLYLNTMTDL